MVEPRAGSPAEGTVEFPEHLPITAKVPDIARAIAEHPVVVVAGATGSGKTTQLPKIALAMGRGLEKVIGVTQPRRIAATSVSARIAEELGTEVGKDVGYKVRFDDKTSPATYVKVMTDGILLAEIQGDPLLSAYDTLVIDEAHERSLTIDFLLGYLRRILPQRPDLKVVVSSATLETERFSQFFGGAPVIEVEGRTFPVTVLYEPRDEDLDLGEAVAKAVHDVAALDSDGDILAFLPGEREIHEAARALETDYAVRHAVVQPLYARLTAAEQARVFAPVRGRRIVLATNVAETSLTLPGIVFVVDPGLARLSRYDARSGTTRLQIEGISQASAEQRKGRSGRVREGVCVRLFDEQSFSSRPAFTDPEIKRTGLAGVILRMKALGLGEPEEFPFLDAPDRGAWAEGYRVLEELGAIGQGRELLPLGKTLARFPVDPRISRMIVAGNELGCLREVLVVAAGLSVPDVRDRPRDQAGKADEAHKKLRDERSDFVTLLRTWDYLRAAAEKGGIGLRRACREGFLSYMRVREWREVWRQLSDTVDELGLTRDTKDRGRPAASRSKETSGDADALHRALLTGLLSRVGEYHPEPRTYVGAKQTRFLLHPSSGVAKRTPAWVMAFELVETSQLFARMVARIEPDWILEAGAHLVRRSYADPHFSPRSGKVVVRERATLYGLVVAKDRLVDYARIEPAKAREIFIEHALVRGELESRGAFVAKNAAVREAVATLRAKARASDMIADDDALFAFFDRRIPANVTCAVSFEVYRKEAEARSKDALALTLADVLVGEAAIDPHLYPDAVEIHGAKVPLSYVFDPHEDADGITAQIPESLVPQLRPGELDFTVPGWQREQFFHLFHGLPKAIKGKLGSIPDLAAECAALVVPFRGELVPRLVEVVEARTGVSVPESAFRPEEVPHYLRLTCRIVADDGKIVCAERFSRERFEAWSARARASRLDQDEARFGKKGSTSWDFGDIPEVVSRRAAGTTVKAYPVLVDRGASVDLALASSEDEARTTSRIGVRRLVALATKGQLATVLARFPRWPEPGLPSRAHAEAFREHVTARILDHAFELDGEAALPRTAKAFDMLLARGKVRLEASARDVGAVYGAAAKELEKTSLAMRSAEKHPSATLCLRDLRVQVARLASLELVSRATLVDLGHYPRYLRAAQARLGRAIADPRKDLAKGEPLVAVERALSDPRALARRPAEYAAVALDAEELRVALFAPELRPSRAVSPGELTRRAAALLA